MVTQERMKRQVYLKISGNVQGVFFRAETEIKAKELKLTGWVRNNHDGEVEILAQGEEENLRAFLEWCKKGPPSAKVTGVKVEWQRINETFHNFSIRDLLENP